MMNKQFLILFTFFILNCRLSSMHGMQGLSVAPLARTNYDRALWVETLDKVTAYISSDIMQYCNRLKLAHTLYRYGNKNNPLPVKFTQQELADFIAAMTNFQQAIDQTQASFVSVPDFLLSVMSVSEKCGAYLLYALCVSRFFHECGVEQIDKQHIIPFLEAIKSPLKVNISRFGHQDTAACTYAHTVKEHFFANNDFSLECHISFVSNVSYRNCTVYNSLREKLLFFTYRSPYEIHLFSDTNVLAFVESNVSGDFLKAVFYDLDKKAVLEEKETHNFAISKDKRYVIVQPTLDCLVIYDCRNPYALKSSMLLSCSHGSFSPDGTFFSFVKKEKITGHQELCVCNIADIDWTKKTFESPCAVIKKAKEFKRVLWSPDSASLIFQEDCKNKKPDAWTIKKNVLDPHSTLRYITGQFLAEDSPSITNATHFLLAHLSDKSFKIYHVNNLEVALIHKNIHQFFYNPNVPDSIAFSNEDGLSVLHYKKDENSFEISSPVAYNGESFLMTQRGLFMLSKELSRESEKIVSDADRIYDEHGHLLMHVSSPKEHHSFVSFSAKSKKFGDVIGITRGLRYQIPCCYLKPTSFFPELTLPQMMLLMGVRKKDDTFEKVRKNDPVDTILCKFGNKQQGIQKCLGIEYQKQ